MEAIKIASLDLNSDFFKQYESVEVENVNELLFDGAKHSYAKFIDGVMIMEERVCLEVYETIWEENFPLIIAGDHCTAYGTIAGIKKADPKVTVGCYLDRCPCRYPYAFYNALWQYARHGAFHGLWN